MTTKTAKAAQNGTGARSRALEPVGVYEIAERLEVRQDTVNKWRDRFGPDTEHPFPEPRWFVSNFPAWNWPDVITWHTQREKRLGRG